MRRTLADRLTQTTVSMPYDDFLAYGKERLPEILHERIANDIAGQRVGADLILIGWVDNQFAIFRYNGSSHDVQETRGFVAIGSGCYVAESVMFQRKHLFFDPLEQTIYKVYEAQRLGSIAPGVGEEFSMAVLRYNADFPRAEINVIGDSGQEFLANKYQEFGPRKVAQFDLPENFYIELD